MKGKQGSELDEGLTSMLREHQNKLQKRQLDVAAEISTIEKEQGKKITSDSIREGWSSGVCIHSARFIIDHERLTSYSTST